MTIKLQDTHLAPELTFTEILRRANWYRLSLSVFVISMAFGLSISPYEPVVAHFNNSRPQFLCRLWITASLIITLGVSFWIYIERFKYTIEYAPRVKGHAPPLITSLNLACFFVFMAMIVLVVVTLERIYGWQADQALDAINFLSGIGLVGLLLALDTMFALITREELNETLSFYDNPATPAVPTEEIINLRIRLREDWDVVRKLDGPIFFGMMAAWMLGYRILPELGEPIYAQGFATGATALQLLIGNLIFEVMYVCSERTDSKFRKPRQQSVTP